MPTKHLQDLFATRAQNSETQFGGPATPRSEPLISLAYGLADPALFPRAELLAATADVLEHDADLALNYGPAYAGLREQLVTRLRAQGVEAEDNNVLVSYGSGQKSHRRDRAAGSAAEA